MTYNKKVTVIRWMEVFEMNLIECDQNGSTVEFERVKVSAWLTPSQLLFHL